MGLVAHLAAPAGRKVNLHRLDLAAGAGIFALSLLLYVISLAPDVASNDAGEFQFVTYVLGIAHPPGYPLYTVLGKAFTLLPFGPVAYRVNLMSAFFGAATLSLTYLVAVQACEWGNSQLRPRALRIAGSRLAAVCGTATLAATATWWSMSTVASVRPLNAFFVALTVFLAIRWAITRENRWLNWLALAFGLSLTHHISMWALAPAFLAFGLATDWQVIANPGRLWGIAWRATVPLLINLYLPIRSAMGTTFDPTRPTNLNSFLDLVLAREFSRGVLSFGWDDIPQRLYVLNEILLAQFGWVVLALAALGLLGALFTARKLLLLIGMIGVANAIVAVSYRDVHMSEYLIPSYLIVALLAAFGISVLSFQPGRFLGRFFAQAWYSGLVIGTLTLALPAQLLITNFDGVNRNAEREMRVFASQALQVAGAGSSILADWHDAPALWYMQLAEGQRPDVSVVYTGAEGGKVPLAETIGRLSSQGNVYLTSFNREIATAYRLRPVGPLFQVLDGPDFVEPEMEPGSNYTEIRAILDGKVLLLGYQVHTETLSPGEKLRVTLFWKALEKMDKSYKVFSHLMSADGHRWAQSDGYPSRNSRPTTSWEPDEIVADELELVVMADTPPGQYHVQVGMYEEPAEGQWRRLPVVGGNSTAEQDAVALHKVTVLDQSKRVASAQFKSDYAVVDLARLVGYDVSHWNGTTLGLTLYWRVLQATTDDFSVALSLVDGDGRALGQHLSPPVDGHFPTSQWLPGQVILDRHEVTLEAEPQGNLQVQVRLTSDPSSTTERGATVGQGAQPVLAIPRSLNDPGRVRINLGNKVSLTAWQVEPKPIAPGKAIRVALVWEPVTRITDESSVFVHVVGKDGRKWAQHDGAPVANSYSTLGWVRGMKITDQHVIRIPPDMPPGEYSIEVGFYSLRTGENWSVLDRGSQLAGQGDRIVLGPVLVEEP